LQIIIYSIDVSFTMLKIIKNIFIVCTCFLFCDVQSFSQSTNDDVFTNFKYYTTKDGFYADKVNDIVQDSLGFLWFGTSDGLYIYDGNTFSTVEQFSSQSDLLTAKILFTRKDRKNNVWIGTSKGLLFFDHLKGIFKVIQLLANNPVYVSSMAEDGNGKIWLGTDKGIFTIIDYHKVTHLFPKQKIHCPILLANESSKDRVFFVTHNHIVVLNNTTNRVLDSIKYSDDIVLTDDYQLDAMLDQNEQLWIGKYDGDLIQFNLADHKLYVHDLKEILKNPSAQVNHFFCQDNKRLWMTINEGGVVYYDYSSKKFKAFETPSGNHIPCYKVTSFFIDRESNYWFAMEKNGLAMTNNLVNSFHYVANEPFGKNKIISAILKDSDGNLWVGSDGGGLYLFDKNKNLIKVFKNNPGNPGSLGNDAVLTLFEDSKKRIWVGTFRGGLSLYNKINQTFMHYTEHKNQTEGLLRNDIRKIVEDRSGNLWLVVHGKGVSCFNPEKETFINYSDLKGPWTNDIRIAKDQSVWVASSNGVSLKKNNQTSFGAVTELKYDLPEPVVNCLYEDQNQQMWFGTLHGLYFFNQKNNQFQKLTLSPILSKASVKSINQDPFGQYYIATNIGLFRYNKSKETIDHFGVEDGLYDDNFIINAAYKNINQLYLGTSNGYCWFDLSSVSSLKAAVPIYLTDIKVFNKSIQFDTEFSLDKAISLEHSMDFNYDQNYLTFNFAFPSFVTGVSKLHFEYKLEGFDKDWQSGNNQMFATYTSIPPGQYELHVRLMKNNFYSLSNGELVFRVIIHPPFYETWWFRLLIVVIIVSLVVIYFRIKTRQLAETNKLLESKIKARTAEILEQNNKLEEQSKELQLANATKDKLFSIIAHDLRSPFTTILAMSEYLTDQILDKSSEKVRDISKGITKASRNAHQVLENLLQWAQNQTGRLVFRPEWVPLNQTVQSAIEGSELQCLDKNIKIEFRMEHLYEVYIDASMFDTMIRNLLHNAIKYSHRGGKILIDISVNANGFTFAISDSGIGMDSIRMNQILNEKVLSSEQGTTGEVGTGLGLLLIKEFIQLHGATWKIISEIGKGTLINIEFPCSVKEQLPIESTIVTEEGTVIHTESNIASVKILDDKTLQFLKGKNLLIVDDQQDIRLAIKLQLEDKIQILEASNGKEALLLAKDLMPDIIISDVVMPEMNGIEFSTKIKNDILTSHIPLILLTSQKEEQDILTGLQTGVDDYLLKPFNGSILLLKIANLLQNRDRVKKKFSLDDAALLDSMSENSLDKQFLVKIMDFIGKNISNEEFSVEKLSEEIGMHRSNLTKKIAALTGMTPNELIKSQRMKLAARLLRTSGKNISEVAYEVGFSDPKYFSKAFKAYFGLLPSDYVVTNKE